MNLKSYISNSAVKRSGFSLVEVLIVITLLALIVLALMQVFSSTQRAFRASVTQTDVLEGSRAAMELITSDLRRMTPSGGQSNLAFGAVNLFCSNAISYLPLQQNLPGNGPVDRVNVLNYFFILGRENTKWIGVGYVVNTQNTSSLYTLYRYYSEVNITTPPRVLFDSFTNAVTQGRWTNMSPIIDGVVHLVLRANDANGVWLTNGYTYPTKLPPNVRFFPPVNGEVGYYFFGNSLPASVELQLGVLEDRARARAESLPTTVPAVPPNDRRTLYLADQSGAVHVFRQQVNIPNVDRSVYQ